MASLWRDHKPIWNHRFTRFCPLCLAEEPLWRAEWELYFHDACPVHSVWMVDQCSSCGKPVSWSRSSLLRCDCGSDLRAEVPKECPEAVAHLSQVLASKLTGVPMSDIPPPLKATDVPQSQQAIRFFGAGLDREAHRKPLKIRDSGSMAVSWNVTSVAAEILVAWPAAFHQVLDRIQQDAGVTRGHALKSAFGWAYHYLYRGLKSAAFEQIRRGFAEWVATRWKGCVANEIGA